ncbi:MAG TPA: ABC transporter substrate-binding protein [Acidimicrobiales bacterium]|nr:ABC transporter substrate-binding protein [Acidimicrobiales bacterium]
MTRKRMLPMLALMAALSLVTAACGQKANVSNLASGGGGGSGGGDDAAAGLEVGETTEDGKVVVGFDAQGKAILADADSEEAQAVLGGKTPTSSRGGTTATTVGGSAAPTTKVWGNTITIGVHAPITGAAPLPSSFQDAVTFVKNHYNAKGGVHGRQLEIVIEDDQYQPAIATQRCTEMVKGKNAFLLIGAAGTDQIQACARWAASAGVPYLSAGVTEKGLTTLKNYFAISMSYKAQMPYVVKYMKETFPTKASDPSKAFMVYSDTPNFGDAVSAWKDAFPGAQTLRLPRVPSQGDLNAAARELCTKGVQVALPLMAPSNWLFLIGQMTCTPQWAGIGVTMGINEVAKNGCRAAGRNFTGARFFSPFPNTDKAPAMDPEFKAAIGNTTKWDDIWVALWGTTKGMVQILDKVGPELTRAKFVTTAENTKGLATGLSPVLNFSPTNHFGANETHVLEASCTGSADGLGNYPQGGKYTTPTTFLKY